MFRLSLAAALLAFLTACNSSSSVALSNSGDNDSVDTVSDTAQTNDPGDSEPDTGAARDQCIEVAEIGQAFEKVSGHQSDPLFAPALAIDGCTDSASSWSGNQAEHLVLDAGSEQAIQGIYLWMSYQRNEWISIEQSADGENWTQHWRRVQNISETDSSYFSLNTDELVRFVRITGFGSEHNAWTNIAEARWSASGENISGARVWRHSEDLVALHSGDERAVSPHYQGPLSRLFISCPYLGNPVFVDATGQRDDFWQVQTIGETLVYSFDWDHYPRSVEPDFYGAPLLTYEPMQHALALLEPL
ncbi:MAG: discoidin domain-containing protein, partial [Granulosicoccaceae bacterium]